MKKDIHPEYRDVVFHDVSNDFKFITRSTIQTREKIEFEGAEYPLVKVEVSSESHPFYTGKHKIVDTAGRVDKFRKKFGNVGSKTQVRSEENTSELQSLMRNSYAVFCLIQKIK